MSRTDNMGSKFVPISEDGVRLLPNNTSSSEGKLKKRKRCQSLKNGKRSRSKSPNGRRSPQDNNLVKSSDKMATAAVAASPAVKVKIVSPTLRGVAESAKLLRNGIFSFPTETMYTLVSFIEFRRRKKNVQYNDDGVSRQWQKLLDFKHLAQCNMKKSCIIDRPLLYVHSPTYACNYVSFSKIKTFVYKHPQPKNDNESKCKFSAVAFSESHEVLNRLSSAFWPGPVTIFAPVKKIRSRASSLISNAIEEMKETRLDRSKKVSCASLTSLTSESSDDQTSNLSSLYDDGEGSVPMLPVSSLVSLDALIGSETSSDADYFVGMRCPSHPLARRILSEVYEDKGSKDGSSSSSSHKGRNRIPGAIMGFPASILNNGNQSYSCKDVCTNLISVRNNQNHHPPATKPVIHVMNGEDRREMFCVPAGQYCQNSEVSLVIDSPNRTVHLIQKTPPEQTKKTDTELIIGADDVVRALHFQQQGQHSSVTSRAITSVLHKWKINTIRK